MTHWGIAGVHGATVWWPAMMRHRCSVVRLGPSGVHAWWWGSRVGSGSGGLALPLGLGSGGRSGRGSRGGLLLHLLSGFHLGVSELLHVEGLTLGEQLLTLQLQLPGRTHTRDSGGDYHLEIRTRTMEASGGGSFNPLASEHK